MCLSMAIAASADLLGGNGESGFATLTFACVAALADAATARRTNAAKNTNSFFITTP
jgi:hypothetical protein